MSFKLVLALCQGRDGLECRSHLLNLTVDVELVRVAGETRSESKGREEYREDVRGGSMEWNGREGKGKNSTGSEFGCAIGER
eukprot:291007-Hanusia_phi.AAC.4